MALVRKASPLTIEEEYELFERHFAREIDFIRFFIIKRIMTKEEEQILGSETYKVYEYLSNIVRRNGYIVRFMSFMVAIVIVAKVKRENDKQQHQPTTTPRVELL